MDTAEIRASREVAIKLRLKIIYDYAYYRDGIHALRILRSLCSRCYLHASRRQFAGGKLDRMDGECEAAN